MATQWKVYTQDAYNLPGCLPEGYGPETNGDVFDTREDAITAAQGMLDLTFQEELEANGDSDTVRRVFKACKAELEKGGETSAELPYRDEETGEVDTNGYRYVSFSVEPEEV